MRTPNGEFKYSIHFIQNFGFIVARSPDCTLYANSTGQYGDTGGKVEFAPTEWSTSRKITWSQFCATYKLWTDKLPVL